MNVIKSGTIDEIDWELVVLDESPGISSSGKAALFFFRLRRRPDGAWSTRRPFDDTAVIDGEWESAVAREAARRVGEFLASG